MHSIEFHSIYRLNRERIAANVAIKIGMRTGEGRFQCRRRRALRSKLFRILLEIEKPCRRRSADFISRQVAVAH